MLDRQAILDDALARTGLGDFGPDYFPESMGRLIASINAEARLAVPISGETEAAMAEWLAETPRTSLRHDTFRADRGGIAT